MNLQNHFSASRFYKYLKYDLVLNGKTYLFAFIGLILGLVLIHFFTVSTASYRVNFKNNYYNPLFLFTLIGGIVISAGTSFPSLRTSQKSSNYLLLPASILEKLIVQVLFRIIAFIILFIPLYWMSFKMAYGFYGLFEWKNFIEVAPIGLLDFYRGTPSLLDILAIIFSIISLASFLFAGAVYFKKYAVFKTVLAFAISVLMWFLLMVLFSHIFYPDSSSDFFDIKIQEYKINEELHASQLFAYIFGMASSLFLFPLAYFKLKEKEV